METAKPLVTVAWQCAECDAGPLGEDEVFPENWPAWLPPRCPHCAGIVKEIELDCPDDSE